MKPKGVAIRARVQWCKGETPANLFVDLEKTRAKKKAPDKLRKSDNTVTNDMDEIMTIQYEFYDDLYRGTNNVNKVKQRRFLNSIDSN